MSPDAAGVYHLPIIRTDPKPRRWIEWRPIDERVIWVCVALAAFCAGWSVFEYHDRTKPLPPPIVVKKAFRPLLDFECLRGSSKEFIQACKDRRKSI